jgi:hypothetical protein
MFRLYFPTGIPDDEDFARHWLEQRDLAPKPTHSKEKSRFIFSAQQTRMTTLAILKRLRELYVPQDCKEPMNMVPILREAIATLLAIKCPDMIAAQPPEQFEKPIPGRFRADARPYLPIMYRVLDSTDSIIRAEHYPLPPNLKPADRLAHLPDTHSCIQYADKIWKGIPLPLPSTIARVDKGEIPHFCSTCGDPMHRHVHCSVVLDSITRCSYPLCMRRQNHVTKVCPALHQVCPTCGRRGHCQIQHSSHSLTTLDGIFYWWSPLGVYTCLMFLEKSQHRRQHLQDWHARFHLYNVQRNVGQNLFPILGLTYNSLPEVSDQDKTYLSTPLWQFAPNLRKRIEKERKRRAARELAEARQKQAQEEAKAREEAQRREAKAQEEARLRRAKAQEEEQKQEALRSQLTVTIPRLFIEGTPPSPYTPGFLTEDAYVPEFPAPAPLPPLESVLDPNADIRVQKLTQDAQMANLVANGLGEPGSVPVLHAQSQSNLMAAFLLELQNNRKERAALEGKIRTL